MQKIVAVITEYNPLHNGHKYQLDKIKAENPEAIIFVIMSGNIVQRGEFALLDKYSRAEMAIECGVDGVFELPYPYCGSTAELFAYAGVKIASELGAEVLYFGTESDNLDALEKIANAIDSEDFDAIYTKSCNDKSLSFPVKREMALSELGYEIPKTSNDILAIEYIRQIIKNKHKIEYRSIKRIGVGYNDESIAEIMSASGIRKAFYENNEFYSIPQSALEILEQEKEEGRILDFEAAQRLLYQHAVIAAPKNIEKVFDCPTGAGFFISEKAKNAKNAKEFFDTLTSKNFTKARLKRVLLYSLFNIKSISKKTKLFTSLLAINDKGRATLKRGAKISVITKHRESEKLSKKQRDIYNVCKKADEIYETLLLNPESPKNVYKKKPFVK